MSFSFTALQRVERLAPDVQLVQLVDKPATWPMLRRAVARDTIIGPGIALLREHPRVVESMGRRAAPSTCGRSTRRPTSTLPGLGVRAVITDRPAYLLDLLDQRGEVAG